MTIEYVLTDKQIEIIEKLREVGKNLVENWKILNKYSCAPQLYDEYRKIGGLNMKEWCRYVPTYLIVGHNYNKLSVLTEDATHLRHEIYSIILCDYDNNIISKSITDILIDKKNKVFYVMSKNDKDEMLNDISEYGTMPIIVDEKLLKKIHLKDK